MFKAALVAAGLTIAVAAGTAVLPPRGALAELPQSEQPPAAKDPAAPSSDAGVSVSGQGAEVKVDKERGKVQVRAPYSSVEVDADGGQVRVRAPHVNLDVRW
jgi:hypothetical protein